MFLLTEPSSGQIQNIVLVRSVSAHYGIVLYSILILPGAEFSLITESFALLNNLLLPFLSMLDASCPIFDLHLTNVLFDIILPSVLGSSL